MRVTIEVELDGTAVDTAFDKLMVEALHRTNGSTSQTARLLGCSTRKIQYRLQQIGRKSSEFRLSKRVLQGVSESLTSGADCNPVMRKLAVEE